MSFVIKILGQLLILGLGGIPLWFFLFCKWVLSPTGFWQNLFVFGVGIWFLGFVQLVFFVIAVVVSIAMWSEDSL